MTNPCNTICFDSLLDEQEFTLLRGLLAKVPLTPVAREPFERVWPVGGPIPLRSDFVLRSDSLPMDEAAHLRALRLFSSRLERHRPALETLFGRRGETWSHYTLALYAYPQLSELNWHTDDVDYVGAFTYYIHPKWRPRWDGELLVHPGNDPSVSGSYLSPIPNRLVVIKGGTQHKIAAVSSEAGHHLRTAITGFFVRRGGPA